MKHAGTIQASRACASPLRTTPPILASRSLVLFLIGPTAVGKSDIALALAKRIGGEIVSCDSMQVYRGMDIGTAKPSAVMRRRVRHHLIDIVNPARAFNVAIYRQKAMAAIAQIIRRKKIPIVVGGTGLYFRALLDGLFEGPGPDLELRARLEEEAASLGSRALFERLRSVDPVAAAKIHPNNARKIIRALEVCETTGKGISEMQREWKSVILRTLSDSEGDEGSGPQARPFAALRMTGSEAFPYHYLVIGLEMDRQALYRRVDLRVLRMFRRGLRKEVEGLLRRGLAKNPIACQAIGYKEVIGWLRGEMDRATALALVQRNSRRFAKRQFTWFKKDDRVQWLRVEHDTKQEDLLLSILKVMEIHSPPL